MKIGIVNDLAVACEALRRVVVADPALTVAWVAHDGQEAINHAARLTPDLILMDLIMPRVNGVEATRQIMRASPCPILVVTATVSGNAGLVYEALGAGALDAVNTPTVGAGGLMQGGAELVRRIHLVARAAGRSAVAPTSVLAPKLVTPQPSRAIATRATHHRHRRINRWTPRDSDSAVFASERPRRRDHHRAACLREFRIGLCRLAQC